jgi:D-methionine transport system ATP-binding protein
LHWLYELDNVTFQSRDGSPLIDSVSFGVAPHAFVALVGPAGAGKSTLFKLMNRLAEPTSGALYLEGQPLAAIAVRALRQRVMLVGQSSQLLGMTVKQALHYPLVLQQCPARDRDRQVSEVMERLVCV